MDLDLTTVKLGKCAPVVDPRALAMANYVPAGLTPPATWDNTHGIKDWGMLLNDVLGCCTIAAPAHIIQVWRLSLGEPLLNVPNEVVEGYYSRWAGYVPGNAATDVGFQELAVLKLWRASTFTINGVGHNLRAFVNPAPRNRDHLKLGIYLFGAPYIGLALPVSAQRQETWDADSSWAGYPGSWGRHAVSIAAYDSKEVVIQTWGKNQVATWEFIDAYCDEAHVLLSDTDWDQPTGFKYAELESDLEALQ